MHTIDRKRWFCIPRNPSPRDRGAAGAHSRPRPRVPRKRTDSRRRPLHAPHGFPRRQRARTLQNPHAPDGGKTFSVAGSGQASHTPSAYQRQRRCTRTDAPAPRPARIPAGHFMGGSIQADGRNNARSLSPRGGASGRRGALRAKSASRAAGSENRRRTRGTGIFCFLRLRGYTAAQLELNRVRAPHLFWRYIYALESMVHPHSERSGDAEVIQPL